MDMTQLEAITTRLNSMTAGLLAGSERTFFACTEKSSSVSATKQGSYNDWVRRIDLCR